MTEVDALSALLADPRKTRSWRAAAGPGGGAGGAPPPGPAARRGLPPLPVRRAAWDLLDLLRRPALQTRLVADDLAGWTRRILELVERSHTRGAALPAARRRVRRAPALRDPLPHREPHALLAADGGAGRGPGPRPAGDGRRRRTGHGGDPLENRIESALSDLACLTAGLANVMVPATATEADVGFMLGHCRRAHRAGVRGRAAAQGAGSPRGPPRPGPRGGARSRLPRRCRPALAGRRGGARGGRPRRAGATGALRPHRRPGLGDVHLGHHGHAQGHLLQPRNIVTKRFMRALALPEIGEQDVFLCYLPLYHTFGRYLELLGCIFWGSVYCFLESPSIDAVVAGMRRFRPTVFISVPKKWMELQGAVGRLVPLDTASDDEIAAAVRVTSGSLRWGLSAGAPRLRGLPLLPALRGGAALRLRHDRGHGRDHHDAPAATATTPWAARSPGSSCAWPPTGCLRGPYVMEGYLEPSGGDPGFDAEDGSTPATSWSRTRTASTAWWTGRRRSTRTSRARPSPQRVENLFRDFEAVSRVFLVGDHREYSTALIWPNWAFSLVDFRALSPEELRATSAPWSSPSTSSSPLTSASWTSPWWSGSWTPSGASSPPRGHPPQGGGARLRRRHRSALPPHAAPGRRRGAHVLQLALPGPGAHRPGHPGGDDELLLPSTDGQLAVRRLGPVSRRWGARSTPTRPVHPLGCPCLRLWLGNEELVPLGCGARDRPGRGGEDRLGAGGEAPRPERRAGAGGAGAGGSGLLDLQGGARAVRGACRPRSGAYVSWRRPGGGGGHAGRGGARRAAPARRGRGGGGPPPRLPGAGLPRAGARFGATLRRFLRAPGCFWIGARALCWSRRTSRTRGSRPSCTRRPSARARRVGRTRTRGPPRCSRSWRSTARRTPRASAACGPSSCACCCRAAGRRCCARRRPPWRG